MPTTNQRSAAEVGDAGRQIYDAKLKSILEPDEIGQFVAIDIESGEYEVAPEQLEASQKLRVRRPDSVVFIHRVGYEYSFRAVGFKAISE